MRILVFLFTLLVINVFAAEAQTPAEMKIAGDAERAATSAYRNKAYPEFLKQMELADRNRPNHPRLIYNLAAANALSGKTDEALSLLERLTAMGLGYAFEKDEDFIPLRENLRFTRIIAASAGNREPINASTRALEIKDKTLIPESVAFDAKTKRYYVGSVHQRKILSIDSSGNERDFSLPADGLYSVLGIKIDATRDVLWAATSAVPQMRGFTDADKGRAGVFKYDLKSGKLAGKYLLPVGGNHTIGDVWIDRGGTVYATDSASPDIYRIDPAKGLVETFITSDLFASLQGITAGAKSNEIYVADYSKGIYRIDIATKLITQLKPDPNVTLLGIDGLYFYGGKLIAIQNGVTPHRVAEYTVEGDRITHMKMLEANHPDFLEPTLGYVDGDDLVYIANSQWPLVNEKAELQTEKLRNPVVLRISLKK